MIAETIALICMAVILLVFFIKVFNVLTYGKVMDFNFSLLTMALVFMAFAFYYISIWSMVSTSVSITGATPSDSFIVKDTEYLALANYGIALNIITGITGVLTLAEMLLIFPKLFFDFIPSKREKRQHGKN
jgi:hypothetical protein